MVLANDHQVYEEHNPWLKKERAPVLLRLKAVPDVEITLTRSDKWPPSWACSPTPIEVARSVGWNGRHLSKKTPCRLEVALPGRPWWKLWGVVVAGLVADQLHSWS